MSLGDAAKARCDVAAETPPPPSPSYRWKLQQIEFRVRQHEKAVCTLARESWRDPAEAGLVRFMIGAARVTEPAGSLCRQEPRHPTKLITAVGSRARMLSLFSSYVAFTGIFASFLPFFFPWRSAYVPGWNAFEGCDRFVSGACLSGELCLDIDRFKSPLNIWIEREREKKGFSLRCPGRKFETESRMRSSNMWNTEIKDFYCDRIEKPDGIGIHSIVREIAIDKRIDERKNEGIHCTHLLF